LVELLDWPTAATTMFSADQYGRFAALVAESVAAACEITRVLGGGEAGAQPAYLSALTARWREWIETCGAGGVAPEAVLPSWPLKEAVGGESLAAESRTAGDEAWRRWLTEVPGAQTFLPPLVAQIRQCAELKANFQQRLYAAKLESLKEFAYGAGHELNNPLANIATRAQTLLREETHPERRRRLAAINTQAFRAHEMVADMMLFARPPKLMPEQFDLVHLAEEVLIELANEAAAQQTALHLPARREPLMISADPVHLRVALRAICMNSLEAIGRGGNLTVGVSQAGSHSEIAITDDGPGISPEIREKIFDPFFSGREAGRGLGFGLSKCWRIVTLHGGQIIVHCEPGRETTFTITLPMPAALPSATTS
jgi:signal transduction histidine kinase